MPLLPVFEKELHRIKLTIIGFSYMYYLNGWTVNLSDFKALEDRPLILMYIYFKREREIKREKERKIKRDRQTNILILLIRFHSKIRHTFNVYQYCLISFHFWQAF